MAVGPIPPRPYYTPVPSKNRPCKNPPLKSGRAPEKHPTMALSTSVSLPSLPTPARAGRRGSNPPTNSLTTGSRSRMDASLSGPSYGSVEYIAGLETKLMGSRKSEDRMTVRVRKVEEEISQLRSHNERLRTAGLENDDDAAERAAESALQRGRRDLKACTKASAKMQKTYEGRIRLLEETVGDVQAELTGALSKLRYLRKENTNMQAEIDQVDRDRRKMAKQRQKFKVEMAQLREQSAEEMGSLAEETEELEAQLMESSKSSKSRIQSMQREVNRLRAEIKPLEGSMARAERLGVQVQELEEARKERKRFEDRAREMEERMDVAAHEKREQKTRLHEAEEQLAAMDSVGAELEEAALVSAERAKQLDQLGKWIGMVGGLGISKLPKAQAKKFGGLLEQFKAIMSLEDE